MRRELPQLRPGPVVPRRSFMENDPRDLYPIARAGDQDAPRYKWRYAVSEILVARQSFACELDGEHISVTAGVTHVRAGHPLAKANPDAFAPIHVDYDVEDASASPGRKRNGPARGK